MLSASIIEKKWFVIILLAVIVVAAYANSFFNPFMWDDVVLIPENTGIQDGWKSIITAFSPELWGLRTDDGAFQRYYRPMHTLLSVIDYRIWGFNPFGYHLSNTLIHLFNTVLLYFLGLRLIKEKGPALVAAAIFAAHPIHTESVTFISARVDLLSALFLLISFILYLKSSDTAKGGRSFLYGASLFSFLLSLLSKEMSLTFPLLLAIYVWAFEGRKNVLRRAVPYFILLGLYIVFRVFALPVFLESHKAQADVLTLLTTASTVVFDYIRLLVVPYPLRAYYSIVWYSAADMKSILSFALLLVSAVTALLCFIRGKKTAGFAIVWTFAAFAPVLNIGVLGDFSMAERFAYIPSVGFSILAAIALSMLPSRTAFRYASAFIVIVFVVLTFQRNRVWADELVFFMDMVEKAPESAIPHINLASVYEKRGDKDGAIMQMKEAARLAPRDAEVRYQLGFLYGQRGRFDEAVVELQTAVDLNPESVEALNALGMAYGQTGRLAQAEDAFRSALAIDPGFASAAENLERLEAMRAGEKR